MDPAYVITADGVFETDSATCRCVFATDRENMQERFHLDSEELADERPHAGARTQLFSQPATQGDDED